jgi:hypothetical protein
MLYARHCLCDDAIFRWKTHGPQYGHRATQIVFYLQVILYEIVCLRRISEMSLLPLRE